MVTIAAEDFQFDELKNGNPVQIRTTISVLLTDQIRKGNFVEVEGKAEKLKATIISDPIVVTKTPENGYQELAVELSTQFNE
jgi:hypothetical protein